MGSHGRSRDGIELTDELLERCAAEAEAGYDVEKLKPRARPGSPLRCPASGDRYPKSAGPIIVCPACGAAVRLYRAQIPNHQRPQEGGK